ncbi:MAG: glucose-6-phosphate isomerase [Verrucomicrobiae bacterium]|nr:glucose-6-phosphate isomerase [Verrucomicrobiae bacterium]
MEASIRNDVGAGFEDFLDFPTLGLSVDFSGTGLAWQSIYQEMGERLVLALKAMQELESGKIANPDENRMVGHYWLRNPKLAPTTEIRTEIETTIRRVDSFARRVRAGEVKGQTGCFKNFLLIGIGGSALGPQLATEALTSRCHNGLRPYFIDNTDPDGFTHVINDIGNELGRTLCLVVSKSGKTRETHNGMIFLERQFRSAGLKFESHAVAITMPGSELHQHALRRNWLDTFHIWDWVGGRTSFFSAVTLLPLALVGVSIHEFLAGAKEADIITRSNPLRSNPALRLAASWFHLIETEGKCCAAIIPYKDSLSHLSRYLQQLVMESLGKEKDVKGNIVNKGVVIFGNKGSTDQHSFVQQLRDGTDNAFTIFVKISRNGSDTLLKEEGVTVGDYLEGFASGTEKALKEKGRRTTAINLQDMSAFGLASLVAIFERTVGYLASLWEINAYHQPGVEAGKKAAEEIVQLKSQILNCLRSSRRVPMPVSAISERINQNLPVSLVRNLCDYLAANKRFGIVKIKTRNLSEESYFSV